MCGDGVHDRRVGLHVPEVLPGNYLKLLTSLEEVVYNRRGAHAKHVKVWVCPGEARYKHLYISPAQATAVAIRFTGSLFYELKFVEDNEVVPAPHKTLYQRLGVRLLKLLVIQQREIVSTRNRLCGAGVNHRVGEGVLDCPLPPIYGVIGDDSEGVSGPCNPGR